MNEQLEQEMHFDMLQDQIEKITLIALVAEKVGIRQALVLAGWLGINQFDPIKRKLEAERNLKIECVF